jgi:hypothetical protein
MLESFVGRLYNGELMNVPEGPARGSWKISCPPTFLCRTDEGELLSVDNLLRSDEIRHIREAFLPLV